MDNLSNIFSPVIIGGYGSIFAPVEIARRLTKKAGTMQYCFHEKECNEKVGCSNRNWQYGLLLGLSGNGGPFTIQYSLGPFLSF